jgi:hypothetical protein
VPRAEYLTLLHCLSIDSTTPSLQRKGLRERNQSLFAKAWGWKINLERVVIRDQSILQLSTINGIMPKNPSISRNGLPDISKAERDFVESSFFKPPDRTLPTPAHVKSLDTTKQGIVMFPGMQLVVKFGPRVTVEEAVTMWAITKLFDHQIPVPELFGWRSFQNEVLYTWNLFKE